MSPQIIIALAIRMAILLAVFGSAWQIQTWRFGAKEAAHAKQDFKEARDRDAALLANVQQNAAVAIRRADNVILAQNAATVREVVLRRDADGVRGALVSLHDAAAGAINAASESATACLARAATLSELFTESTERYGEVAGKADGHASDVKTLTDAWPQ